MPTLLTTDLALRFDPVYEKISRRFMENPTEFAEAFAKAWYKLLHRDMGPTSRYLGPLVPPDQLWQDPVPKVDHPLVDEADVAALGKRVLGASRSRSPISSFSRAAQRSRRRRRTGNPDQGPIRARAYDATQDQTDARSFAVLEPRADGFRNYINRDQRLSPETLLLDRANLLGLSASEMTVLVGGMRVLGANYEGTKHGVFTQRPGALTNDFFVHLLDNGVSWEPSHNGIYADS